MGVYTFHKEERLKSEKTIGQLFKTGASFGQYPLRLVFLAEEKGQGVYPVKITFSVPKKKFPKAVQRNRLKRLMREAWRLNKNRLYREMKEHTPGYAFMVLYTGSEAASFAVIEKNMRNMIRRFLIQEKIV
ncbi:MAG TPA: ribonuclease P protein component [Saprospiraceae bacterium]|nr:ribonuclease P protein component [Saprospiraceae bacterium]HMQ83505.1 ribonuclease P protein component [Saprospiraceae bacterium]